MRLPVDTPAAPGQALDVAPAPLASAPAARPPRPPAAGEPAAIARGSSYTLAARLAMALCRGSSLVLLSRALGVTAFGDYSLVLSAYSIVSGLGTLGLDQAHAYLTGCRRHASLSMLRNAAWMALGFGTLVAVGLLAVVEALRGRIFDSVPSQAVLVTALCLPPVLFHNYMSGMIIGRSWFRYYGISESCKWALHLGLAVSLALAGRLRVDTALLALYVPIGLCGLAHLVAVVRGDGTTPWRRLPGAPNLAEAREALAFGVRACVANVTHIFHLRLDVYVVKYFTTSQIVGQYALAASITDVILYLARSVGLVLFVRRSTSASSLPAMAPRLARTMIAAVSLVVLAVIASPASLVSTVFGAQYLGCVRAIACRLPGTLAESASLVLVGDFLGRARIGGLVALNALGVVAGLMLNAALVPSGGIVAAACAYSVASWLRLLGLVAWHRRDSRCRFADYFVVRRSDLALVRDTWGSIRRRPRPEEGS